MSRSGYVDAWGPWSNLWRGAIASAFRGKRGQAFLREMLVALDAMPEKALVDSALEEGGSVCAIGAVGKARGLDMSKVDPDDYDTVAGKFGIATSMAREIAYENDEGAWDIETPEQRWVRMRTWIVKEIRKSDLGKL
jgi:hypothetical protein